MMRTVRLLSPLVTVTTTRVCVTSALGTPTTSPSVHYVSVTKQDARVSWKLGDQDRTILDEFTGLALRTLG